jgi:hypothetical protein
MAGFKSKVTSTEDVATLQAQIAALTKKLEEQGGELAVAKDAARAAADAQGGLPYMQATVEEQATGRSITVKRAKNPWVKDAAKLEFETVEMPTYYYKIELPPSGGTDLKINGSAFYHGQVYEFSVDDLRMMKDMVARSWGHEANIKGSNENIFRRPQNRVLSGKAMH